MSAAEGIALEYCVYLVTCRDHAPSRRLLSVRGNLQLQ